MKIARNRKLEIISLVGVFLALAVLVVLFYTVRAKTDPSQDLIVSPTTLPTVLWVPTSTPRVTPSATPAPSDDRTEIAPGFYYKPLDDDLIQTITGSSYPSAPQDDITYDRLTYVSVLHYNFEGKICFGELIVAEDLAEDVTNIFYQLYLHDYPITSIKLIDEFGGSEGDRASMAANNTSAFNYRLVAGSNKLSKHALGRAIDINPMMNPYVKGTYVSPENGAEYSDRSNIQPGMIDYSDLCYQLFIESGWTWGGDWQSLKDYQHFEKP